MKTAALACLSLLALTATVRAASPCDAPEHYVRPAKTAAGAGVGEGGGAPMLRPYVIEGIAAVSVLQDGTGRWLELAVHSADEARRALATGRPGGAGELSLTTRDARVWLRCPAAGQPRI